MATRSHVWQIFGRGLGLEARVWMHLFVSVAYSCAHACPDIDSACAVMLAPPRASRKDSVPAIFKLRLNDRSNV